MSENKNIKNEAVQKGAASFFGLNIMLQKLGVFTNQLFENHIFMV